MDNIKTWTGLSVLEESVRMTEDRDKWRKYVRVVASVGSSTAEEQNRTDDQDACENRHQMSVGSKDRGVETDGRTDTTDRTTGLTNAL